MTRVTPLVAALLLTGSVVAHAQQPFEISVAAGPVFAQGLSYQEEPAGVELSAGIGTRLSGSAFGLRVEGSYASLSHLLIGGSATPASIASLTLNGVFTKSRSRSPLRPYLITGAGACMVNAGARSHGHLGISGGAGILFPSLDHMWSVEVRLHHTTGLASATWFPATLGLQF